MFLNNEIFHCTICSNLWSFLGHLFIYLVSHYNYPYWNTTLNILLSFLEIVTCPTSLLSPIQKSTQCCKWPGFPKERPGLIQAPRWYCVLTGYIETMDNIVFLLFKFSIINSLILSKLHTGDWRDGSVVRSTSCSYRGPRFDFHHPCDGSQLESVNYSCSRFNAFFWPPWAQIYRFCTDMYAGKIPVHIK